MVVFSPCDPDQFVEWLLPASRWTCGVDTVASGGAMRKFKVRMVPRLLGTTLATEPINEAVQVGHSPYTWLSLPAPNLTNIVFGLAHFIKSQIRQVISHPVDAGRADTSNGFTLHMPNSWTERCSPRNSIGPEHPSLETSNVKISGNSGDCHTLGWLTGRASKSAQTTRLSHNNCAHQPVGEIWL